MCAPSTVCPLSGHIGLDPPISMAISVTSRKERRRKWNQICTRGVFTSVVDYTKSQVVTVL